MRTKTLKLIKERGAGGCPKQKVISKKCKTVDKKKNKKDKKKKDDKKDKKTIKDKKDQKMQIKGIG